MPEYPPGLYEVLTTDPAYIDMLELVARRRASQVGQRFLDDGVIQRVYLVEDADAPKRNPAIQIGSGFFTNALRDYSEWPLKWWRECVQNSVDAGSTEVMLGVEELANGNWLVSCEDNGGGMSEDVLINKFLVLGESGKSARAGMIGGFGKAKELLVLPWLQWRITTGSVEVLGSGIDYELYELDEPIDGTILECIMPADKHTDTAAAMEFLQRCSIPGVKFYINGELFTEKLRTGSFIKELSFGSLHRNKSKMYGEVYVRAGGMYMFTSGSFDKELGTIIVDITGDTTKLLTANRDGFASWRDSWEISNFLQELTVEREMALREKRGITVELWEGTGKISNDAGMTDVLNALGPTPPIASGGALEISEGAAGDVIASLRMLAQAQTPPSELLNIGPTPTDVAEKIMHEPIRGAADAEALARQLVWKPDFMVRNEIEWFKVPAKFKPESMTAKLAALAKVWAEACRWVFIQLNKHGEYGVGFLFSDTAGAEHYTDGDSNHWLLLNPVIGGGRPGELYSKTNREHLKWLYAAAVHEVTHMADGYSSHDVAFAYAMTKNMAETADGFGTMVKIAKAIKISGGKPKKKKTKKAPKTTAVTLWYDSYSNDFYVYPDDPKLFKAAERAMEEVAYTRTFSSRDPATVEALWKMITLPPSEVDLIRQGDNVLDRWPWEVVRNLIASANGFYPWKVAVEVKSLDNGNLRVEILDDDPATLNMIAKRASLSGYEDPSVMQTFSIDGRGRDATLLLDDLGVGDTWGWEGTKRGQVKAGSLYEMMYAAQPLAWD